MDPSPDGLSPESMFSVCPIVLEGLALCLLVTVCVEGEVFFTEQHCASYLVLPLVPE